MGKRIFFILLIIGLGVGLFFWSQTNSRNAGSTNTALSPSPAMNENEKTVTVDEIKMSMTIPSNYVYSKESQMNLSTNEPYAVTFTVQNYTDNPTQVTNPYQLYGIYQWDTATTTPEAFKQADFMFIGGTREEFTVDGLPAVKGVTAGERGRYTIYILVDGHQVTLAADGSSTEHKEITDTIVNSIRFSK